MQNILNAMDTEGAWQTHNDYENLHPFTDGNGRSGRMLWAWQMRNDDDAMARGFLHTFYYQTLSACRNKR